MERLPSFMQDGRLVFTTEKREPGFYQLALRRQNLDGGDYHPLYAQRGSIGYAQATYVVELADKDFADIFSNQNAVHGAGALGVFNRSIGIDFTSTNAERLPGRSERHHDRARRSGGATSSCTRSTVAADDGLVHEPRRRCPTGKMLVSFGDAATATFGGDYDLYVLDPSTAPRRSSSAAPGPPRSRPSASIPRVRQGHLRLGAGRAERAHVHSAAAGPARRT